MGMLIGYRTWYSRAKALAHQPLDRAWRKTANAQRPCDSRPTDLHGCVRHRRQRPNRCTASREALPKLGSAWLPALTAERCALAESAPVSGHAPCAANQIRYQRSYRVSGRAAQSTSGVANDLI